MFNLVVEELFCLLFLCAVGSVFAGCLRVLSRSIKAGIRKYKFSNFERLILLAGSVGIGCIGYGLLVEPFKLETSFVTLDSKKIAPSTGTGIHKLGNTWCNVSRGIGMTGLPVRFLCPPEVTVIDIKPQQ